MYRHSQICLVLAATFPLASGAQTASFMPLGSLPSGGIFYSDAADVSADGSVVVGGSFSASGREAFRWTASTGMVGLGDLPDGDFISLRLLCASLSWLDIILSISSVLATFP